MGELEKYKAHVIDQAINLLTAGHDIRCMFTTPKLLEALAEELENRGHEVSKKVSASPASSAGGTEFTLAIHALRHRRVIGRGRRPYTNLRQHAHGSRLLKPVSAVDGYKTAYYAPQPRAVIEVVSFDDADKVVDYGQTGRVRLTTLTRETFIPGFLEETKGSGNGPMRNTLGDQ